MLSTLFFLLFEDIPNYVYDDTQQDEQFDIILCKYVRASSGRCGILARSGHVRWMCVAAHTL